jgi:hypothetical protein
MVISIKDLSSLTFLAFCICIAFCLNVFTQENKCDLQLQVFEYQNNGDELKINNATAIVYSFGKDRKKIKATGKDNVSFFAALKPGIYSAEVIEDGYRKSVRRIYLDCSLANKDGLVTKRVSLWKGNAKETIHVIEDEDYNKVSEKVPFNDLALKLKDSDYPPAARAVRASGVVEALVTIDE